MIITESIYRKSIGDAKFRMKSMNLKIKKKTEIEYNKGILGKRDCSYDKNMV